MLCTWLFTIKDELRNGAFVVALEAFPGGAAVSIQGQQFRRASVVTTVTLCSTVVRKHPAKCCDDALLQRET